MATVYIPLLWQDVTRGARQAEVPGGTLGEIIAALDAIHPGIAARICQGEKIGPHVRFTVDGVIATAGLATPVNPDSHIHILPAFGGG